MTIRLLTAPALLAVSLIAPPAAGQAVPDIADLPDPSAREGSTLTVGDGAEIFYTESGEGEALVLLHGYPLSGALFARVTDALDDDYRVITIDHRGYGNSTTPAPAEGIATYASDALAVLDELGVEEAVIGGMSMGGPIMFSMYEMRPDLFRGMIAIDTNHLPAGPIETGIWTGAETALQQEGEVAAIVPFLIPNMLTGEARTGETTPMPDYLSAVMGQASLDGAIGGARALASRPDATEIVSGADVPILAIVGLEDPVYPVAIARQMVDAAQDGTLAVIDGASHAAIFERPAEAVEAIRGWMDSL
jgi:pimeloyl-ACP methyl ester carboxylesterase